jgi:hypothetical protein
MRRFIRRLAVALRFIGTQPVTDSDTGVTFVPWTDGWAVGFRLKHPDGHVEYIYLNPSSDGGGDPEHRSCVFVYQGESGDPALDTPYMHFTAEHDSPVRY